MEADFMENNTRNAYKYLKGFRQGFKPHTSLCKDDTGITSDRQSIKNTWKRYFQTLLELDIQTSTDNNNNNEHDINH